MPKETIYRSGESLGGLKRVKNYKLIDNHDGTLDIVKKKTKLIFLP